MSATIYRQKACRDCGITLTADEVEYYEDRCERCEGLWCAHMTLWRLGKVDDPEMDRRV